MLKRWTEIFAPTPAILILFLGNEGYYIKHWFERPGFVWGWRQLQCERSHWVMSGALEIIFENGASYTLRAGDRDILPAGLWYQARVVGEERLDYFVGEKFDKTIAAAAAEEAVAKEPEPETIETAIGDDSFDAFAAFAATTTMVAPTRDAAAEPKRKAASRKKAVSPKTETTATKAKRKKLPTEKRATAKTKNKKNAKTTKKGQTKKND